MGITTRRSGLLPQNILPDDIFEKFKGPGGHDNPSFGAFAIFVLPDVIFEKFKGPCRHDNPSFGALAPTHFCRVYFWKFKSPCGHDNPSFGALAPNHFCRVSFFGNLKAPAGMTTRRSGLLPQTIFAGCHF